MYFKSFILTTAICFSCFNVKAQDKLNFCGKLITAEGKAVSNAKVKLNEKTTLSGPNGKFCFENIDAGTYTLEINHISFESMYQVVVINDSVKDRSFRLQYKVNVLNDVEINLSNNGLLIEHKDKDIIDFAFAGENIYLLGRNNATEHFYLEIAKENGELITAIDAGKNKGDIHCLMKDYNGYVYALSDSSLERIFFEKGNISLIPMNLINYYAYVRPVVDTVGGCYLLSDYDKDYPRYSYYYCDKKTKVTKHLVRINEGWAKNEKLVLNDWFELPKYRKDSTNLEFYKPDTARVLDLMGDDFNLLNKNVTIFISTGGNLPQGKAPNKKKFNNYIPSPLFIIHDTICVFNMVKNKIFIYDKRFNLIDTIAINFHKTKPWNEYSKLILKDEVTNELYAVYKRDGYQYIKRINWRTGKTEGVYKLNNYSAQRLKIKNDYIYGLYSPYGKGKNFGLYWERIDVRR